MTGLPPIRLSDAMRQECERRGVTDPETIAHIARFETFLRHAGPVAPLSIAAEGGDEAVRAWNAEHLTDEQRAARKAMFADPEWRAWLLGDDEPTTTGDQCTVGETPNG